MGKELEAKFDREIENIRNLLAQIDKVRNELTLLEQEKRLLEEDLKSSVEKALGM